MGMSIVKRDKELDSRIDELELAMLKCEDAILDLPLKHTFTDGIYVREIFNPAGALITTKIHKIEHPFVLLKGRISTYIPEEGGKVQHITAPYIGVTRAGTRRVIYAHEDSVFITFHPNPENTQNLDKLENKLVEQRLLPGKNTTAFQESQKIIAGRQLK